MYTWAFLISFIEGIYEHPDVVRAAPVGRPGPLWDLLGSCGASWALVGPLGVCGPGRCKGPGEPIRGQGGPIRVQGGP